MLERRRFSRASLFVASILISALIGVFFLPELVSTYWHARHGESTSFQGWALPVPRGWWAFVHDNELIIQRMNRVYDRVEPSSIVVGSLSPGKPVDPEVLREELVHTLSKEGYIFQQNQTIRIGNDAGYCVHFLANKDHERIRISCESLGARLSLDLFGRQFEIQPFYSVIGQIKRQSIAGAPR
jgi:hypothetical protein